MKLTFLTHPPDCDADDDAGDDDGNLAFPIHPHLTAETKDHDHLHVPIIMMILTMMLLTMMLLTMRMRWRVLEVSWQGFW